VQRVLLLSQYRRRRASHQHHAPAARHLADDVFRDPYQRRLVELGDDALGGREELGRRRGERAREPLDEAGRPLVALRNLGQRDSGALRHLLDQLVVHH
jgi:hypothetical protein